MRRKLLLPALAACCLLAVGAPLASASTHRAHAAAKSKIPSKVHKLGVKISGIGGTVLGIQHGIKALQDIDLGQTAAINQSIADHTTLKGTVDAIVAGVPAIIDGLTQLKDGLTTVGAGLTTLAGVVQNTIGPGLTALSTAVQGPGIAGQLGAAGASVPGSSNTATPSTLPTGTVYREIVLSSAANGVLPAGTPIGVRLWVKMPDAPGLYSNAYTCLSGRVNSTASGTAAATGGAAYASALTDCPPGS